MRQRGTFAGETIQMGRFNLGVAEGVDRVVAEVVGEDKNQIRTIIRRGTVAWRDPSQGQKPEQKQNVNAGGIDEKPLERHERQRQQMEKDGFPLA